VHWTEVTLSDVCSQVTDGTHDSPKETVDGYPLVTGKAIKNRRIDFNIPYNISEEDHLKVISRSRPQRDDILFANIGNSIGDLVRVDTDREFSIKNVALFKPNKRIINPRYLEYFLFSPAVQSFVINTTKGSAQPFIGLNSLRGLPIALPSLEEQTFIAHILGSLDDKIELNRQMNATLEAMAQALFKSWFVDFDPVIDNALAAGNPIPETLHARAEARAALGDQRKPLPEAIQNQFPNRFVFNDDLGWVPEGWDVSSLESMIELIGGGTPKTAIDEYWNGEVPWFSVVDAPNKSDVFVLDTEKHVTPQGIENSSAKLLPVGTTIISARGTVGKCAVVGKPMAMNQSCYGVRGSEGYSDYFTYYTVLLRVADLQQRSHGSVFSTITRDTFRSIKTAKCPPELSSSFDQAISDYMSRIVVNLQSNKTLTKLRNTLLPKLLSGQLRIPEAEQQVASAGVGVGDTDSAPGATVI